MRKQFDIKYRPQIESGEYKVETRDGRKARIIHWDLNCTSPIVAVMDAHIDLPGEIVDIFSVSGRAFDDLESPSDLFIVTPEEELTEFEIRLLDWLSDDTSGEIPMERMKEVVRNRAAELLSIAREQFIKDGYVIEKKAFHDAVKKVSPEVMKEVSDNVDMQIALHTEYEKGRADALKDLPRWSTNSDPDFKPGKYFCVANALISPQGWSISFKDLEKLPGFKEDEKDIVSLIQSRLKEILGDAQPNPILRAELRELIKKIKEEGNE